MTDRVEEKQHAQNLNTTTRDVRVVEEEHRSPQADMKQVTCLATFSQGVWDILLPLVAVGFSARALCAPTCF
jgi:hypothetical protein